MYNRKTRELKWLDDELRYLYESAGKISVAEMSKHLNRSKNAIQKKCNHMGFKTRLN